MIRSVAVVRPADPSPAAGRGVSERLLELESAVDLAPGPGLLIFPASYFIVDSYAGLARIRRALDDRLRTRHPTVFLGVELLCADGSSPAPPPGLWGPPDADVDPWIPRFALVRHRRGWLWEAERQRVHRPGQRLTLLPRGRVKVIDGETVALALDAEADVLEAQTAAFRVTLRPGLSTVVGRLPARLIQPSDDEVGRLSPPPAADGGDPSTGGRAVRGGGAARNREVER